MAVDKDGNEIVEGSAEDKAALEAKATEDKAKADAEALKAKGPDPQIDATAVANDIASKVSNLLTEQAVNPVVEQPNVVPHEMNPLHTAIDERVLPQIQQADTNALDAKDAAIFYASNEEAKEYTDQIEAGCANMKKQGTPMTRKSIWSWYKGEHQEEFFEKRMKAKEAETEAAKHNVTIEGGGHPNTAQPLTINYTVPDDNPDEKLDKALDNAQF